jgi:hypothetical protein
MVQRENPPNKGDTPAIVLIQQEFWSNTILIYSVLYVILPPISIDLFNFNRSFILTRGSWYKSLFLSGFSIFCDFYLFSPWSLLKQLQLRRHKLVQILGIQDSLVTVKHLIKCRIQENLTRYKEKMHSSENSDFKSGSNNSRFYF